MLVDSHCHLDHLDLTEREGGLDAVLADAQERLTKATKELELIKTEAT